MPSAGGEPPEPEMGGSSVGSRAGLRQAVVGGLGGPQAGVFMYACVVVVSAAAAPALAAVEVVGSWGARCGSSGLPK